MAATAPDTGQKVGRIFAGDEDHQVVLEMEKDFVYGYRYTGHRSLMDTKMTATRNYNGVMRHRLADEMEKQQNQESNNTHLRRVQEANDTLLEEQGAGPAMPSRPTIAARSLRR